MVKSEHRQKKRNESSNVTEIQIFMPQNKGQNHAHLGVFSFTR